MELTESILRNVRKSVGLSEDCSDYDTDLLMHINNATAILNQNGIGKSLIVNESTTWEDFQDLTQTDGNRYFHMIPLYIALTTKMIFDPPPPSTVQYYASNSEQILWRLKVAYEEPYISPAVEE